MKPLRYAPRPSTSLIMLLYGGVGGLPIYIYIKTCTIDTWDVFKREIKKKFYSEDVVYLARKNMKHLKHTGSIHEYVKEFFMLMLEIPNMSEDELLFNFMDNL